MRQSSKWWICLGIMLSLSGCADSDDGMANYGVNPEFSVTRAPLNAYCQVNVNGVGTLDMENDYLPNVIWCENGGSNDQGLRVQAVAARTYAYYSIGAGETIYDGTKSQVYSCKSRAPSAEQLAKMQAAVDDTSGVVLRYQGVQVCGFFVAGAKKTYLDENCRFPEYPAESSDLPGWENHQKYVTYNYGLSGTPVNKDKYDYESIGFRQTTIGYISKTFKVNRGCMAQNGSTCLGDKGWEWREILKFFYGSDIEIVKTEGDCVKSGDTCTTQLNASGVIIDDKDGCFSRSSSDSWKSVDTGHDSHLYFAFTGNQAEECVGTWKVNVTRPGLYEISAYIASGVGTLSAKAPYVVRAKGVEHRVVKDLTGKSGWVSLGKFEFASGGDQWVKLSDLTGEAYSGDNGHRVVFDAIKFEDAVACENTCTGAGVKECSGNGVRTCADENGDGCYEWSAVVACDSGQICQNGACEAQTDACKNECDASGMRECSTDSEYHECGQFDDDACLEWSPVLACGSGLSCTNGACVDGGEPETSQPIVDNMPAACLTEVDGRPSTIIDDFDACFVKNTSSSWAELSGVGGYDDHLYYAYLNDDTDDAVGTWYMNVTKSGKYTIYAYVDPDVGKVASSARYEVRAGGRIYRPTIDTDGLSEWVSLGNYALEAGAQQYIRQTNSMKGHPDSDNGLRVIFDAIKVVPYVSSSPEVDDNGNGESGNTDNPENSGGQSAAESACSAQVSHGASSGGLSIAILGLLAGLGMMRRRRSTSSCR